MTLYGDNMGTRSDWRRASAWSLGNSWFSVFSKHCDSYNTWGFLLKIVLPVGLENL